MDRYKLMYEMKIHNVSVDQLCEACGISKSSFYRKCKNNSNNQFNLGEINRIKEFLKIPKETMISIFFAERVSEKTQTE